MNIILSLNKKFISLLIVILLTSLILCVEENGKNDDSEVKKLLAEMSAVAKEKHGASSRINQEPSKLRQITVDKDLDVIEVEAPVNRADLFEGDIVLTVPQAKHILAKIKGTRLFSEDPTKKWPVLKIPYILKSSDQAWQESVRKGLQHVEEETCIRFYDASSDLLIASKDHLQFTYVDKQGCFSKLGRVGGGGQEVSIGPGCTSIGTVAHETLHALGVWHEQSRDDRENFIRIFWDNIQENMKYNFDMHSTGDKQGMPYDLGSAMHYSSVGFSKTYPPTHSLTLETRDKLYQQTIGQRNELSFRDAKGVNQRYCTDNCARMRKRWLKCENGGYTDPNNCSQCRCPEGYGGTLCTDVAVSKVASCTGGELTAKAEPQILSGHFDGTGGGKCYWRIRPEASNQQVELTITNLRIPCPSYPCPGCQQIVYVTCFSYLEIKFREDKVVTGPRLCCGKLVTNTTIVSDVGTNVLLIYKIDEKKYTSIPTNFTISYKTVGPGEVTTPPTPPPPPVERSCMSGYTEFNGNCYKPVSNKDKAVTHAVAEASCVSENGHLASIHSQEEQDFVAELVLAETHKNGDILGRSYFWLGIVIKWPSEAAWTDGSAVDFAQPEKGKGKAPWEGNSVGKSPAPNNYYGEEKTCAVIQGDEGEQPVDWAKTWTDVSCDNSKSDTAYHVHNFVCKKAK